MIIVVRWQVLSKLENVATQLILIQMQWILKQITKWLITLLVLKEGPKTIKTEAAKIKWSKSMRANLAVESTTEVIVSKVSGCLEAMNGGRDEYSWSLWKKGIFLVSGGVQSTGGSSYNALPGVAGGTQSPYQAVGPGSHSSGAVAAATPAPPPLGPGAGAAEPAAGPLGRFAPYFDAMTPRNVTALVGKSAYLSCRVRNLGNKTVSWIRHRDIHILTVGSYTYTSDQRFQANHHAETDEWTLQIKWAQKRDAGIYECQISTQPVRSYFVNLNVVVPTAAILGGPDIHVDKSSTINLTCSIRFSPEPPAYIFWYHHDDVISYDSSRGGVTVITEKGDVTTSVLLIQHAEISDSGKYSCSPSNADVASVRVYVLNGERPAAMQTGSAGLSNSSVSILTLMALLYLYTVVYTNLQLSSVARTSPTAAAAR